MLVLSRKREQTVALVDEQGTTITVRVLSIEGGKIRLGFDAPRRFSIVRGELLAQERQTVVEVDTAEPLEHAA